MEPNESTDVVAHTLRITAAPWEEFQQEALEKVEEVIEDGIDDKERIIAFEDARSIQRVLTPKRLELIKSVMEDPPESMRQLASRLERSPSEVHNDVHLLGDYGIIEIQEVGRSKQPIVPYESIKIEVELSLSRDPDDAIAKA